MRWKKLKGYAGNSLEVSDKFLTGGGGKVFAPKTPTTFKGFILESLKVVRLSFDYR